MARPDGTPETEMDASKEGGPVDRTASDRTLQPYQDPQILSSTKMVFHSWLLNPIRMRKAATTRRVIFLAIGAWMLTGHDPETLLRVLPRF